MHLNIGGVRQINYAFLSVSLFFQYILLHEIFFLPCGIHGCISMGLGRLGSGLMSGIRLPHIITKTAPTVIRCNRVILCEQVEDEISQWPFSGEYGFNCRNSDYIRNYIRQVLKFLTVYDCVLRWWFLYWKSWHDVFILLKEFRRRKSYKLLKKHA